LQCHTLYVGWYVALRLDVSNNLDNITSQKAITFISDDDLPTFWHDTVSSRNEPSDGVFETFRNRITRLPARGTCPMSPGSWASTVPEQLDV